VKVHQLLAALSYGDAIGNEAARGPAAAARGGARVGHLRGARAPPRGALARPLWEYGEVSSPQTVCIYHFSIGSAAGRLVHGAPDRLVIVYHNITPAASSSVSPPPRWSLPPRPPRARGVRVADRARPRRLRVQPCGARGVRLLPDRRPAHRPGPVALRSASLAGRPQALRRRPGERPLRGAGHPEQAVRGPDPELRRLPEVAQPRSRLLLVGDTRGFERYLDRLRELVRELGSRR